MSRCEQVPAMPGSWHACSDADSLRQGELVPPHRADRAEATPWTPQLPLRTLRTHRHEPFALPLAYTSPPLCCALCIAYAYPQRRWTARNDHLWLTVHLLFMHYKILSTSCGSYGRGRE